MTSALPSEVRIVEVGPRDGLQNEAGIVPVEAKVALIEALVEAGLRVVEAGSFVSPKWVPQMADTATVLARLNRIEGVSYPVLVPNMQGFEAARAARVDEIAVFGAASESFSPPQYQLLDRRKPGPVPAGRRCGISARHARARLCFLCARLPV